MQLVGYEFSDADGPVVSGFLHLGSVTVLIGANDVGKSRLLRTIANGATSLDALLTNASFRGNHRFFVKLHPEDALKLLTLTYQRHLSQLRDAGLNQEADEEEAGGEALPWLSYLPVDARDLHPRSSTFAFEALADWCGKPQGGAPGLLVSWCRKPEPLAREINFNVDSRAVLMGTLDVPVLPVPVELPVTDPAWLREQIADSLTEWLAHLHWAVRTRHQLEALGQLTDDHDAVDAWIDVADSFFRNVERRPSPREVWTLEDADEQAVAYRPLARSACTFVGQIATRVSPAFVRDRYELRVSPVGILDWSDRSPITIALVAKDGSGSFDAQGIADGLRLWTEMALLEAAEAMRRVELNLRNALLEIERARNAVAVRAAVASYLEQLAEAMDNPVDPPFERSLGAALALAPGLDSPTRDEEEVSADVARRVSAARPRLYLLDEPERHLNPRLQRAAAQWLVDLLETRGSQGLIATHAHAFLNVGAGPTFVEVRRQGGKSKLAPFEAHELTAYSEIAKDIGWDRGELLTSVRVLAFVEGQHDRAVLEELFSLPFHHAGVVLVPIAGVGRHAQIVEHDVLIRFTRATIAVVFDKLDRKTIARLQADDTFRRESLRSRQTELQAMASLLHKAAENERDVHPVALPVPDIFDALDEDMLRDQFPDFPGHAAGNEAWEREKAKIPNRKVFHQERYGVPNAIDTYRKIAALMRSLDRIPEELQELGAQLELLAAGEA
jgi:predicted ATPase